MVFRRGLLTRATDFFLRLGNHQTVSRRCSAPAVMRGPSPIQLLFVMRSGRAGVQEPEMFRTRPSASVRPASIMDANTYRLACRVAMPAAQECAKAARHHHPGNASATSDSTASLTILT